MVWAMDFQFDSTIDGKTVKIASMVDEHTRESLLNIVDRSITSSRVVAELAKVIAVRGTPAALRLDNGAGVGGAAIVLPQQDRYQLHSAGHAVE
ncbi:DDE-type integrase/transposase/recombinase [Mycobacteroides salmoniphilum]|uniref:DDE-type integrase/transposase/recombinase n=1 Tax=Mycobacteroides salmoniphilum TaxID=404941 RepID=UPI002D21A16F|nr:DDE-type integrase/transposase/recombinase [Mycobacteroides salmoniphilum]